jgi:hypothetical protein
VGDHGREDLVLGPLPRAIRLLLSPHLFQRLRAGTRDRLVRAGDDPHEARGPVDRGDRHAEEDRRAVGVRDDALVAPELVAVQLGDDERALRVHAERGRVVDHDRARAPRDGAEPPRDLRAGAEQREVHAPEGVRAGGPDLVVAAEGAERPARGALGREEPQLAHGEAPLLEDRDHLEADRARRADDRDRDAGPGHASHGLLLRHGCPPASPHAPDHPSPLR